MASLIEKLKLAFGWTRNHSPSQKSTVKTNSGPTATANGTGSAAYAIGGDVYLTSGSSHKSPLKLEDNRRKLLELFSEDTASRIEKNLSDPKLLNPEQNVTDYVKRIKEMLEGIAPSNENSPLAQKLIEIRDVAKDTLTALISDKDSDQFLKDWVQIGTELQILYDSEVCS